MINRRNFIKGGLAFGASGLLINKKVPFLRSNRALAADKNAKVYVGDITQLNFKDKSK